MKSSQSFRKYMNRMRKRHGKRNGVVPGCLLDFGSRGPHTSRTAYKRNTAEKGVPSIGG